MVKLLAPAGSFASLEAAIQGGADAIYFGIRGLNMRSGGKADFTIAEMAEVVTRAHDAGINAYLTLNTILYDNEVDYLEEILAAAKAAGVDAIIAWDFGIIKKAKEHGLPLHVSTQASISNYAALTCFAKQGATTAVLARELDLNQIKHIIKQRDEDGLPINIECFIHGAICISVSGRCFMSQIAYCKSANRGECIQPCRRSYLIKDEEEGTEYKLENNFVMSPKDLCVMPVIDHILDAKIDVLKIEGRNRSPDYVLTVTKAYREAITLHEQGLLTQEKKDDLLNQLATVYNKGFSTGFYMGKPLNEWAGVYGSKATTRKEKIGRVTNYYTEKNVVEIQLDAGEISAGDPYYIIGPTTGVLTGKLPTPWLESPVNIVKKGDLFTFKQEAKTRPGDDFYKITTS